MNSRPGATRRRRDVEERHQAVRPGFIFAGPRKAGVVRRARLGARVAKRGLQPPLPRGERPSPVRSASRVRFLVRGLRYLPYPLATPPPRPEWRGRWMAVMRGVPLLIPPHLLSAGEKRKPRRAVICLLSPPSVEHSLTSRIPRFSRSEHNTRSFRSRTAGIFRAVGVLSPSFQPRATPIGKKIPT